MNRSEVNEAKSADWSKTRKQDYYAASDIKKKALVSNDVYQSNLSELAVAKYMRHRGYSCLTDFSTYMHDRRDQWDKDVVCGCSISVLCDTTVECDSNIVVKSQMRALYKWAKEQLQIQTKRTDIVGATWVFQREYQNRSADPLLRNPNANKLFCGVLINDQAAPIVCTLIFYYWPSIGFLIQENDPLAEPLSSKLREIKKALYLYRILDLGIEPARVLEPKT